MITVTAAPRLEVDTANARGAEVGLNGGMVSATAGGVSYTLDIPVGALNTSTRISLTPVKALRRLPAGGEFVAAVKLEPSGLVFKRPAMLKIRATVTPVAGKSVLGYLAADDGTLSTFAPAIVKGDSLMIEVPHFTIAGWGQFVPGQLPPPPPVPSQPTSVFYQDLISLAAAGAGTHGSLSIFGPLFRDWYHQVIEPGLKGTRPIDEEVTVFDYERWVDLLNWIDFTLNFNHTLVADLQTELDEAMDFLPSTVSFGIRARSRECRTGVLDPIEAMVRILQLQSLAARHMAAADLGPERLDTPTVLLDNACIQVVNSKASIPASLVPNQPVTLDLRYGYQVASNPMLVDAVFKVTALIQGTQSDGVQISQTDAQGKLTGTLVPTGATDLVIGLVSCLHPSLGPRLDEVCLAHEVSHLFGRVLQADVTIESDAGLAQIADVSQLLGSLTIQGANVTSSDLHELSRLTEVSGALVITGLPNLATLAGMSSLRSVRSLQLLGNPALHSPTVAPSLTHVDALFLSGRAMTSLSGLGSVPQVNSLVLLGLGTTSLAPLNRLLVVHDLDIIDLPGLTSLTGLKVGTSLDEVTLSDNPVLADISALAGVTQLATLDVTRSGPSTFSLPSLGSLNDLGLNPDAHAVAYQFPALTSAWRLALSLAKACTGRASPLVVSLPALQALKELSIQGASASAPNCFAGIPTTVQHLSLESVHLTGGGITSFTAREVRSSAVPNQNLGLSAQGLLDMTQLSVGSVDVNGSVEITSNPLLRSIDFGAGVSVKGPGGVPNSGSFVICRNLALTSVQFGGGVTVSGGVDITGNPNLPIPNNPPWPITATTQRISQQDRGCR